MLVGTCEPQTSEHAAGRGRHGRRAGRRGAAELRGEGGAGADDDAGAVAQRVDEPGADRGEVRLSSARPARRRRGRRRPRARAALRRRRPARPRARPRRAARRPSAPRPSAAAGRRGTRTLPSFAYSVACSGTSPSRWTPPTVRRPACGSAGTSSSTGPPSPASRSPRYSSYTWPRSVLSPRRITSGRSIAAAGGARGRRRRAARAAPGASARVFVIRWMARALRVRGDRRRRPAQQHGDAGGELRPGRVVVEDDQDVPRVHQPRPSWSGVGSPAAARSTRSRSRRSTTSAAAVSCVEPAPGHHDDAVAVADEPVRRGRPRRARSGRCSPNTPRVRLLRLAERDAAAEHREAQRADPVAVAHGAVGHEPGEPARRADAGEDVAEDRDLQARGGREREDGAGRRVGDGVMQRPVVAGRVRGPCRRARRSARRSRGRARRARARARRRRRARRSRAGRAGPRPVIPRTGPRATPVAPGHAAEQGAGERLGRGEAVRRGGDEEDVEVRPAERAARDEADRQLDHARRAGRRACSGGPRRRRTAPPTGSRPRRSSSRPVRRARRRPPAGGPRGRRCPGRTRRRPRRRSRCRRSTSWCRPTPCRWRSRPGRASAARVPSGSRQ